MRFLGIDYGEKRIGIAISDEGGRIAFPHTTILNNDSLIEEVGLIVEQYGVEKIIIGDSKDYEMKNNRIMDDIKDFVEDLKEKLNIETDFHPEFMTSTQASKTHFKLTKEDGRNIGEKQKVKQIDAQAAAIMLQSFIDSN
jgi:putative holliday junction resolvase